MIIDVEQAHELRLEIPTMIRLRLISGHAEHKGQELVLNRTYKLHAQKTFVFCFKECKFEIEGEFEHYSSENSNTLQILRLFRFLVSDERSDLIANFKMKGNVFRKLYVLGNGKSTFVQTLTNYLVRNEKSVMITEISCKTGFLCMPGCVGTTLATKLIDCQNPNIENTLAYFYGHTDLNENKELYMEQIKKLFDACKHKNYEYHIIIGDEKFDYKKNTNIQEIKEKNNIYDTLNDECTFIVLKDEKLYARINQDKIFIEGGIHENKSVSYNIQKYFSNYSPFHLHLKSKIVRIGEEYKAPEHALPIGEKRKIEENVIIEARPKIGSVLGVSYAENEEDVINKAIKAIVLVEDVTENGIKVLSAQKSIKSAFLIQGDVINQ